LNDQGKLADYPVYGGSLTWGISGFHAGKRTAVGLTYRGSYSVYGRAGLNSLDQSLLFSASRRLSARTIITLNSSDGMYSRNFGLLGLPQGVPFDPATTNIPTTDFFDKPIYYSNSQLGLIIQKSARLSFGMSGGLYLIRRASDVLYGTTGLSATGDVQYRLNRRTTIGAMYSYMHVTAFRVKGTSDMHSVSGSYSRQLSRRAEFSGFAGVVRPELKLIQTAPVDPVIAALLGITQGTTQISHTVRWSPTAAGRLSWVFRTGVAYVAAGRTISPGNGLFLTSTITSYSVGYSYTGLRRWSFSTNTNYAVGNSIQNVRGGYRSLSAAATVSRSLSKGFHWYASYAARKYSSPSFTGYNRTVSQASIGFGYSPGDLPLRVW